VAVGIAKWRPKDGGGSAAQNHSALWYVGRLAAPSLFRYCSAVQKSDFYLTT
jgi:hypothetical protein